jgi:hypothetical protein
MFALVYGVSYNVLLEHWTGWAQKVSDSVPISFFSYLIFIPFGPGKSLPKWL